MHRQHTRRHGRRQPHFPVRAGKRLAAWARKLADDRLTEDEELRMEETVQTYLRSGADQVFEAALAELADDAEARAELEQFVEFEIECVSVPVTTADGNPAPGFAWFFAIPLVGCLAPGVSMPTRLEGDALDAATTSFRRHGLIGPEPTVVLFSHLYSLKALALPFSRQWHAIRRAIAHWPDRVSANPFPDPKPAPVAEHFALCLRFLTGFMLSTMNDHASPFSEASAPIFDRKKAAASPWLQPRGQGGRMSIGGRGLVSWVSAARHDGRPGEQQRGLLMQIPRHMVPEVPPPGVGLKSCLPIYRTTSEGIIT